MKAYRKVGFCSSFLLLLMMKYALSSVPIANKIQVDSLLELLPKVGQTEKTGVLIEISKQYLSSSIISSQDYALMAISSAKEQKDTSLLAEAYKTLGNVYYYLKKNNEALCYYDSSLKVYSQLNDSARMAKIWNNLGIVYKLIGDYQKSIDFQIKSLNYKISTRDSTGIINSYNNLGSFYYELEEINNALEYFQKALDLANKFPAYNDKAAILNNLGLISQDLSQYKESIQYLDQALSIYETNHDQIGIAGVNHNLGKAYYMQCEFRKALDYYFKANKIYIEFDADNSHTLNNIGQVYIDLDYLDQAITYLNNALKIAKNNSNLTLLRDIYNNFSVAYDHLGDYKKAYDNYLLFNRYDDSLKNKMFSNKIVNLSNLRQLENKRKELENLNLETQLILEKKDSVIRKRNFIIYLFIAGIAFILTLSIVLLTMFKHKAKANKLLRQQNEEIIRSDNIIKKINKALSQNEGMLRSIFDASPSAIIVINDEFAVVDCNNASISMFGAGNKREILNKRVDNLIIPDQISKARDLLNKAFEDPQRIKSEFVLVRRDGSSFNAEVSGGLIKDTSDKFVACVLIINDITERLHFIEHLKQAKLEAEESDRLKTAFLANMSHEIRTPMNSIIGFSNLLNDPDLKPGKKEEYLHHIQQSSNSLLNLIDDIIDISKIEAGQITFNPVDCNVNNLLKDLYNSIRETTVKETVKLKLQLPPGCESCSLKTDPMRLRQILTNLIGNAFKFTEKGYIEMGYYVRKTDKKRTVEIYLKDTGIGIPKDKQAIIFESFRQVDDSRTRRFGGTGLGLAISKKLTDLLGGTIWVESESKKGSTFYLSLPAEPEDTDNILQTEHFNGFLYDWKGKTILIAEDENSNFELLKAAISKTKLRILRARNGEDALEQVKKNDNIDLILMDIRMPVMNGYEATKLIKNLKPDLPVISITAYAMSEDETKSFAAGCDMYLSKPIRPSNLLTILNGYLS